MAFDKTKRVSLFYEEYPGSINDVSQFEYMVAKVVEYYYSIKNEITEINSELTKLQEKKDALSDSMLKLQKQKKDYESKQLMEASPKNGKSLQELMTF